MIETLKPTRRLLATPAMALAQDDGSTGQPAANGTTSNIPDDNLSIAVGVGRVPTYGGSDESRTIPVGMIRGRVSGYAFGTMGTGAQLDLIRQQRGAKTDWKFGPLVNVRLERTGRTRDAVVDALGERDTAIELGLYAGVSHTGVITSDYDSISASVSWQRDVAGAHDSWIITPTISYGTPLSRHSYVGLSASMQIVGKGYGQYYYDIDAAQSAASGLPVYTRAGDGSSVGRYSLAAFATQSITGDLRKGLLVGAGVQYSKMTGDIGDAPIVSIRGSRNQWMGGLGLIYRF